MSQISVNVSHSLSPLVEARTAFQIQLKGLIEDVFNVTGVIITWKGYTASFLSSHEERPFTGTVRLVATQVETVVCMPQSVFDRLEVTQISDNLRNRVTTLLAN